MRQLTSFDRLLGQSARQIALQVPRTCVSGTSSLPASARLHQDADSQLTDSERLHAGALMRVNHVGEICAQALYSAQGLMTKDVGLREHFAQAAKEEEAHLEWTAERVAALGAHVSYLNPLWALGAFGLGLAAGKLSDRLSLGFVVETEKQVEQHLASHLQKLPPGDLCSREVVALMQAQELQHARDAQALGAEQLPAPLTWLMRQAAKLMTTVAYRL
jgi:3-demethoxyubiquinol 3-hydroxylase